MGIQHHLSSRAGVVAVLFAALPMEAPAQTTDERRQRGAVVINSLNGGAPQPVLERMRQEFPFLAEATEAYALAMSGRDPASTRGRASSPPSPPSRPSARPPS